MQSSKHLLPSFYTSLLSHHQRRQLLTPRKGRREIAEQGGGEKEERMDMEVPLRLDMEDDGAEEDEAMADRGAFERHYADERSWEELQEDESGMLRPLDVADQQRQHRKRMAAMAGPHIQRGIIRYVYLLLDFSRAAAEMDLRPSRMGIVADCVEAFIREFFDQNPLSHLGIILLRNGIAHRLTDLSGSPETHIRALRSNMECAGDASIQNALDLARGYLTQIPSYGHREVVLVFSALSTIDPGDIMEAVQLCKDASIRCSVVGLSAEIFVCKMLCDNTGGTYSVATNEGHLKELIMEHAPPPPTQAEMSVASLVRMGFPQRGAEDAVALCACHREVKIGGGYTCPRCKARVCELPTQCHICGLTLVSSPHLARSYHHLFPVPPFEEITNVGNVANGKEGFSECCYGCLQELPTPGGKVKGVRLECPRCKQHFCFDCDIYIHESLHNCPGCESTSQHSQ